MNDCISAEISYDAVVSTVPGRGHWIRSSCYPTAASAQNIFANWIEIHWLNRNRHVDESNGIQLEIRPGDDMKQEHGMIG